MQTTPRRPEASPTLDSTPTPPAGSDGLMRAVVQRAYGTPDVLRVDTLPRPVAGAGEVLLQVRAASLNQGDWHLQRGEPYLVRALGFGLRRPKQPVPGLYAAGTVAAVGPDVTTLRPGDEVYGPCKAAFAEFACARADALVPKPAALTFEQAAALPHGGFTALQALRDAGRLQAGQRVLVIGAAGAVGLLAVQIAKALGAHVTGVCLSADVDFVRRLGADRVIDDTSTDFASEAERYELILDMVRDRPNAQYRRVLAPRGRAILVSGGTGRWLGGVHRSLGAALGSLVRRQKFVPFLAVPKQADLLALNGLVDEGRLRVPVARAFPLQEAREAFHHLGARRPAGMLVVVP